MRGAVCDDDTNRLRGLKQTVYCVGGMAHRREGACKGADLYTLQQLNDVLDLVRAFDEAQTAG